jgi:hypothetical protein
MIILDDDIIDKVLKKLSNNKSVVEETFLGTRLDNTFLHISQN